MAAPQQGAAIFSSQSTPCVAEALEQRAHLAVTPLSAYWPLKPGWRWVYNESSGPVRATSTEKIMADTVLVHGERAFQRLTTDPDGELIGLENVSASGRVQWHRVTDDTLIMTFSPAWAFPKYARVGQRSTLEGGVDMKEGGVRLRGQYQVDIQVLKMEKIKVPAGTFSTVKIQMSIDISVEYHRGGHDASLRATGTDTQWLAKGIGKVKEIDTHHLVSSIDGKRKVEDDTVKNALRSFTRPTGA
jgi:hypothetical protein